MKTLLRYAGMAAVLAGVAGAVAYLGESYVVTFCALLAMHLALVLAVTFVILSVRSSNGDSSDPPLPR